MSGLNGLELSTSDLADLLEVSTRRVQQLAAEGAVVRSRRGYYALRDSMRAYVAWLEGQAEGSPGEDERSARARKLRAEAELKERQLAGVRGETVPVDFMAREFEAAVALIGAEVRNLPSRFAADVRPEDPAAGELLLERVTTELLEVIAQAFDRDR
jgi:phage terminase Nu1 subunit (DNA packaging protein)